MMNNLSNTLTLNPTTTNLTAAVTWAEKSLGTLQTVWKTAPEFSNKDAGLDEEGQKRREMCELVKGVALFNLGVLKEVRSFSQFRLRIYLFFCVEMVLRVSCFGVFER